MRHLRDPPCCVMMRLAVVLTGLLVLASGRRMASRVRIGMDGGYSDILVHVSEDLPRTDCKRILAGLKVILRILRTPSKVYVQYVKCFFTTWL
jgi:hypothetical protein